MYVFDIVMFHKTKGKGELNTTITIHDDGNTPVSGATVYGTLERLDEIIWDGTLNTNGDGKALLKVRFPISGATYEMCVTNVSHSHTYDPSNNCETKYMPRLPRRAANSKTPIGTIGVCRCRNRSNQAPDADVALSILNVECDYTNWYHA